VFDLPGLGRYFVDAAVNRDYSLMLGLTGFGAIVLGLANLASDSLCAWLDPRMRYDYQ
jgi:oligopeptide transport system permease protein